MNLCLAFRQIGVRQKASFISAASPLPSAQNNPDAKVAYFGVVLYILLPSDPREINTSAHPLSSKENATMSKCCDGSSVVHGQHQRWILLQRLERF